MYRFKSFYTAVSAFASLGLADDLKVGLISDLHLHLRYDPQWSPYSHAEGGCMHNDGVLATEKAPMGRYLCDSPEILISTMLRALKEQHEDSDVIFVTGDYIAHQTAKAYPNEDKRLYAMLLSTHARISSLLAEAFPDTLILPVFGNNDQEYHDNPIPDADADFFYNFMYDLWFKLMPGNASNLSELQKTAIYLTFRNGGYYRVDLTDKISFLAMNTMYYDSAE